MLGIHPATLKSPDRHCINEHLVASSNAVVLLFSHRFPWSYAIHFVLPKVIVCTLLEQNTGWLEAQVQLWKLPSMLNLAFHSTGFAHLAFAGLQAKVEHSNPLYPANLVAAKATIVGLSLTCHEFVYHNCTSVLRP